MTFLEVIVARIAKTENDLAEFERQIKEHQKTLVLTGTHPKQPKTRETTLQAIKTLEGQVRYIKYYLGVLESVKAVGQNVDVEAFIAKRNLVAEMLSLSTGIDNYGNPKDRPWTDYLFTAENLILMERLKKIPTDHKWVPEPVLGG